MGAQDKKPAAIPLNTFKQDYVLLAYLGGAGGVGAPPTGCSRYTFWLDCDPFDVNNRSLISQNVTFEIFSDTYATTQLVPYVIAGQADDIPDELVVPGTSTSWGDSIIIPGGTGLPPYVLNTQFTSQPANTNYQNDQGRYSYPGYVQQGTGFGHTQMVGQGFVPKQAQLSGFFFAGLFHTNTTDHTTYFPLVFELWDSNHNFYAHLGTLQPTYTAVTVPPSGLTTDASCTAFCNNLSYNVGDNGLNYWITLNSISLKLTNAVNVTIGQTYYIMVRQQTLSSADYYFLGNNTNAASIYSGTGRYTAFDQFGASVNAHAVVATDGSSTFYNLVDTNSFPVDFPFITQGNVGRIAITFWWGNQPNPTTAVYWHPPWGNPDQFKFIHLDYDQRI